MTAPGGLLDFFTLEAAEYLDRLDGLASGAGATGPDVESLHRNARALRGSATMARQPLIAELAASLERVAKALRDGTLRWDAASAAAVVSGVDELRTLVRSVKSLTSDDETRARALTNELDLIAPSPLRRSAAMTPVSSSTAFLAVEIDELASGIAALRRQPDERRVVTAVAERIRRLRGVAALKDLPPLAEVIEGVERAIRPVEENTGRLQSIEHELLAAAVDVFTHASVAMRQGERPAPVSPETRRFSAALAKLDGAQGDGERVVPIAELYFAGEGPHVLHTADAPPMTRSQRFRIEVVSLAEHLRRLVGDARAAADEVARDRLGRELRGAMRTLQVLAESFGDAGTLRFVELTIGAVARLDADALTALDEAAQMLGDARVGQEELSVQLATLTALRNTKTERVAPTPSVPTAAVTADGFPLDAPPPRHTTPLALNAMAVLRESPEAAAIAAPLPTPAPIAAAMPTSAPAIPLQALLQQGLAGFGALDRAPLAAPTSVTDDTIVSIDRLLYRGRAALDRAIALRETIKRRGGAPADGELDELFDLLDLVATE